MTARRAERHIGNHEDSRHSSFNEKSKDTSYVSRTYNLEMRLAQAFETCFQSCPQSWHFPPSAHCSCFNWILLTYSSVRWLLSASQYLSGMLDQVCLSRLLESEKLYLNLPSYHDISCSLPPKDPRFHILWDSNSAGLYT